MRNLTQQHKTAITLLIAGKKQTEVARILGVIDETVTNWMKDELFTEVLAEEREKWTSQFLLKK